MTTQQLSALLDDFERSAHAASVNEENYRREVAVRLKELENDRAFGFRRLNLMRTVIAALQGCETEEEALAGGSAAFLREVGWSSESEAQQEALEQFHPDSRACWQTRQLGAETEADGETEATVKGEAEPAEIGNRLNEFERWFGKARNGPFLSVLEREIVELPLVEVC